MVLLSIFGSILSSSVEIHSLQLGIEMAGLALLVRFYASKWMAGGFISAILISIFVITPLPVIIKKPWYFMTGFLFVICCVELAVLWFWTKPLSKTEENSMASRSD